MRLALAALLLTPVVGFAADPLKAAPPESSSLDAAWKDLLSPDEAKATRAALALATAPKDEVVAFLAKHLRPVKADKKLLNRLFNDLGDRDAVLYEPALAELEYFGRFIKTELQEEAKGSGNPLVRERAGKLLADIEAREKLEKKVEEVKKEEEAPAVGGGRGASVAIRNGQVYINGKLVEPNPAPVVIERPGPPAGWVRAGRGIAVLEHVGTPEAVKLLEQIALGEDNAPPTKQAQDALARLKRKK